MWSDIKRLHCSNFAFFEMPHPRSFPDAVKEALYVKKRENANEALRLANSYKARQKRSPLQLERSRG
jgi:hypothetical protein